MGCVEVEYRGGESRDKGGSMQLGLQGLLGELIRWGR